VVAGVPLRGRSSVVARARQNKLFGGESAHLLLLLDELRLLFCPARVLARPPIRVVRRDATRNRTSPLLVEQVSDLGGEASMACVGRILCTAVTSHKVPVPNDIRELDLLLLDKVHALRIKYHLCLLELLLLQRLQPIALALELELARTTHILLIQELLLLLGELRLLVREQLPLLFCDRLR